MVKRSAIYLRSSKDRHDVSVESQRRELHRYVQEQGDIIVAEFEDKVESAKTANRPAFQEMMGEVKSKECRFDRIYCFDTSRFSRRQYDAQLYKHLLKKNGIELHFLKLPKTDPLMDTVLESLMEIFDEFHSQKSKMDGLRGMRENIKQGWRAGGTTPPGYRIEKTIVGTREGEPVTKSTLIPDPKTFHTIQKYLKGRINNIARNHLVESLGLEIAPTSLLYMEDNALTYAGHTVWNRANEVINGKRMGGTLYKDRSEWVIKENTHEPMITNEEADYLLNHRAAVRKSRKRRCVNDYLLSGLVQCQCGANMDGDSGFYRCHVRCGNRGIKKETLEKAVISFLFEQFLSREALVELKDQIDSQVKMVSKAKPQRSTQIQKEINSVDKQVRDLLEIAQKMKHQRPVLEKIDILEDERSELVKTLAEVQKVSEPAITQLTNKVIDSFLNDYKKQFSQGDVEKKKGMLRTLIDSSVLGGDTLKINPSYACITGAKVVLPRGIEPLFPA